MTTINTTNQFSADSLTALNGTKTNASATAEAQDRFLKLLVTQMQNQDPLNPMDNAEVTSQMAQLSTVTGIDKLNSSVNGLLSSFQANQSFQAANVIGRGILADGSAIALNGGKAAFGIDLSASASSVAVAVKNASGTTVATLDLGSQEAGIHPYTWDGKDDAGNVLADGKYTFEVTAKTGGLDVTASPLTFGIVNSVTTGAQGVKVNTDTASNIEYGTVRQIL